MGSSSFCLPILEGLFESENDILAVYTQPPKPAGRGKKFLEVPVALLAKKLDLELRQPINFKEKFEIDELKALNPDVIVVVAYGLILPKEVLKVPQIAPINIHASILPNWRGAAPMQRAIINGERSTGLSIMQMDQGLDTGPIYDVLFEPIFDTDTYSILSDRLSKLASNFLLNFLDSKINGTIPIDQKTEGISYAEKISKSETRIDWSRSAKEIDYHIRGLADTPGAWTSINQERVKILLSKVSKSTENEKKFVPGTVLEVMEAGIRIICGDGQLFIKKLQRPGKTPLMFNEFVRGYKVYSGQTWL